MSIPWSCHVCSKEFDKYDGGICSRCKRATCMKDLKLVGYDKKQGAAKWEHIVCGTCITPEEDSVRFRKSLLIESSWFRALETKLRKKN